LCEDVSTRRLVVFHTSGSRIVPGTYERM
jgi:hypothetical protein